MSLLYALSLINKNMTNEHYEKYKETIKRVARRNYQKRIQVIPSHETVAIIQRSYEPVL